MLRTVLLALAMTVAGCASQPHASLPPSEPVVTAPESNPETAATDVAMFAERLTRALALIVTGLLSPEYQAPE